jgi:hypothetical protein
MLTISKAISPAQAQTYHSLEYTSDAPELLQAGRHSKGRVARETCCLPRPLRRGCARWSSPRLTEGKHPQTEEQMVKHREGKEYTNADGSITKPVEHRAGWDATFSAPKSVSLTALVGGDERVRDAHRAAVTTALEELEKYTHARIGGNNPAEQTGKFIAAKFEHDTARPVNGYAAPPAPHARHHLQCHRTRGRFDSRSTAPGSLRVAETMPPLFTSRPSPTSSAGWVMRSSQGRAAHLK